MRCSFRILVFVFFFAGIKGLHAQGAGTEIKWLIGKVDQVSAKGMGVITKDSQQNSFGSGHSELLPTEEAKKKFSSERSFLPSDIRLYLNKGGTFWESTMGLKYIRDRWIRKTSDYGRYFNIESLFFCSRFHDVVGIKPTVKRDEPILLRPHASFKDVLTGDIISCLVVSDGVFRSSNDRNYAAYKVVEE